MSLIESISQLNAQSIEAIEKLTLRWVFQAIVDFGFEAYTVFQQSPNNVKDIAEDITREVLDRLAGYNIPQRILGTVDYKRARYIILPEFLVRQALFVDSKAEKSNINATLQLSQTSMLVRQVRSGMPTEECGTLPAISRYGGKEYLTTTIFLHFYYADISNEVLYHDLKGITAFCIPNGLLQALYNPNPQDTFWLAGRNAPSLGEEFRVRVSFARLKEKAAWRVQQVGYLRDQQQVYGTWSE